MLPEIVGDYIASHPDDFAGVLGGIVQVPQSNKPHESGLNDSNLESKKGKKHKGKKQRWIGSPGFQDEFEAVAPTLHVNYTYDGRADDLGTNCEAAERANELVADEIPR